MGVPWGAIGSLAQSLLGGVSHQTTDSSLLGNSTYNPTMDPATIAFLTNLMQKSQASLNPVNTAGYGTAQEQGINRQTMLSKAALNTALASRGLSSSPISLTANQQADNTGFQQLAQFRESLPLLSNQLMAQNLQNATGLFGQIPKGATTSQSQTGTSTTTGGSGLLGMI
jgi:hypothetical protein